MAAVTGSIGLTGTANNPVVPRSASGCHFLPREVWKHDVTNKVHADTGFLFYDNRRKHAELYEEMEARLDEVEGTLRGHIGLIEDSLKRIEDRQLGKKDIKGGWGQGMSAEAEENYGKRGKDDRKKQ